MQLRYTIVTPSRFCERDPNNIDAIIPTNRPHREHKDTIPAYLQLLKQTVVDYEPTRKPAAFPSKKLITSGLDTQDEASQKPSEGELALPQPLQERTLNDFVYQDVGREGYPYEPQEIANPESVEPLAFCYDRSHDMQTSPQRVMADELNEMEIAWSMLDEGLQVFVYDSLMSEVQHPVRAAVMLGLTVQELHNVAHLSNLRKIHPATVNQLWSHCSPGNLTYIEPKVLSQYMSYMNFAATCDWRGFATDYQKRLAVRFLRQRKINGPVVIALLDDLNGVFVRPETADSSSLSSGITYKGAEKDEGSDGLLLYHSLPLRHEAFRWNDVCESTSVHDSHDLDAVAPHFKCCFFPRALCKELLVKPRRVMNAWELWLIYGLQPDEARTVSDSGYGYSASAPTMSLPLSCLLELHRKYAGIQMQAQKLPLLNEALHLCLHSAVDTVRQNRVMHKKVQEMPLTSQEKTLVYASATKHVMASTRRDVTNNSLFLEATQASISLREELSDEPTTLVKATSQWTSGDTESSLNQTEILSSPTCLEPHAQSYKYSSLEITGSGDALIHNDTEGSSRKDKSRSETVSTDATLPVLVKYIDTGHVEPLFGIDQAAKLPYNPYAASLVYDHRRRQSSLTDSFHTVQNENEDVVMASLSRPADVMTLTAPERPPISPISDWDAMELDEQETGTEKLSVAAGHVDVPESPRPYSHRETSARFSTCQAGRPYLAESPYTQPPDKPDEHNKTTASCPKPQQSISIDRPAQAANHTASPKKTMLIPKRSGTRPQQCTIVGPAILADTHDVATIGNTTPDARSQPTNQLCPSAPTTTSFNAPSTARPVASASSAAPLTPPSRLVNIITQPGLNRALKRHQNSPGAQKPLLTTQLKVLRPNPISSVPGLISTPITQLTSKLIESGIEAEPVPENQPVLDSSQPKQKSPRKDKGKKRAPYNTKKRKAEELTAAADIGRVD